MIILKIGGGGSIDHAAIVSDLKLLTEPFIIVHGANHLRDQLANRLSVERKVLTSVSGYDSVYSDEEAIDMLMMAYAGLANKRLVALCQQHGINAVGLSGLDGRAVVAKRNAGIRIRENGKNIMVHDRSGKPISVNKGLIDLLLSNGYVPLLCVPLIDEQGSAVNSENDDIVALFQRTMGAETVIHLIEAKGYLSDPTDAGAVVSRLSSAEITQALVGSTGRIKRKLLSISRLLENGVSRVIIADGRVEHPIQKALAGEGTIIS